MRSSRLSLALSLVVVAVGLSACSVSIGGSDKIDHAKAEKFVKDNIHPTPTSVTCPSGVKETKGGTFACTFTLPNGKSGTVTVHMTDSSGGVHFGNADIHIS
jgi:hypothetical protein